MIELLLIVTIVMFGTLLFDKHRGRRHTFRLKEPFNATPSYMGFTLRSQSGAGHKAGSYQHGFEDEFNPQTLNANMETYQPIDYDNNIASIYGYKPEGYDTTPKQTILTCTPNDGLMGQNRWCGCEALSSNGTSETATRRLIGGVNPRTLIAPQIAPPITDMEAWGTDNYTIHSATNSSRSDELFLSGYVTLDNCRCGGTCACKRPVIQKPLIKEGFDDARSVTFDRSGFVADHNFLSPYDTSEQRWSRPQILQNQGISRVPEQHVFTSITNGDDLLFIERSRRGDDGPTVDYITGDEPSMIYDPRMVGYSDSDRAYVDKLLGQPKFYYDDINAARGPNYITRNKIDIYSFGESTGRLRDPKSVGACGDNNQLAVEEFHNSALLHRADLMQSLMNKRNGEMWQLRQFPISTNGQRMLGGTSKI
jgi:hypothetical protein